MKNILFLSYFFIFFLNFLFAGETKYPVSEIPDALKKDADAVVRMEEKIFEILNTGLAVLTYTRAVTILNNSAAHFSQFGASYDTEDQTLEILFAQVYDANGKLVRKLKKNEIHDQTASGSSFFTSSRVKWGELELQKLPFTVEYSYVMKFIGLTHYPNWYVYPYDHDRVSVEKSEFIVAVPNGMEILYKLQNFDQEPKVIADSKNQGRLYKWSASNFKAIQKEPLSPSLEEIIPAVLLAPKEFTYGKYSGSMDTWKSYGTFFYELNKDRDELPRELAEKVKELTEGASTEKEKIWILYKFLRENTRYVSIQLGIGGNQTFEAEYVYKNGYGDCKALSNYMKGMLKEIGIPSYLTVIYRGDDPPAVDLSFAYDHFNHMILCVPTDQDTLWLECTNDFDHLGYVGLDIGDRYAVVVTPEGGRLLKTPTRVPEANPQHTRADVYLHADGHAEVKAFIRSKGYQQDNLRYISNMLSEADQEKYLRRRIDVGSFDLKSFSMGVDEAATTPTCTTSYELKVTNCGSVSGSRIFLSPNLLNRNTRIPEKNEERKYPVRITYSYLDLDTVIYHMPEGYVMESMQEVPIEVKSPYGTYRSHMKRHPNGTYIYTRMLRKEKMELPPSAYPEYREFLRSVVKADKMQVVLSKKS